MPSREAEKLHDAGLTTRGMPLRVATHDEATRSIEAVIVSAERAVRVFDWARYEIIDEVLILAGAELPDVSLLDAHSRESVDDILGSVRNWQTAAEITGRVFFAEDDRSERAYTKAKGGHLRNLSVGYEVLAGFDIDPGATAEVDGRVWTAGQRRLRISQKWAAREVSVLAVGADDGASFRAPPPSPPAAAINHRLAAELADAATLLAARLGVPRAAIVDDLAGALGQPASTVNRLLAGALAFPTDRLAVVAGVLEIPAADLAGLAAD